jgi:hypothetical protein
MRKRRFASLLLTGKAATLPLLMHQAHAEVQPTFADAMQAQFNQFEMPVTGNVRLDSIANQYGGNYVSATACTDVYGAAKAQSVGLVLTGLHPDDTIFVATSTSIGGNESYRSDILIGAQKLMLPIVTRVSGPSGASLTMTVSLNLSQLSSGGYPVSSGSHFYVQSIVFPSNGIRADGSLNWSLAKLSKLDTIQIASCANSSYTY